MLVFGGMFFHKSNLKKVTPRVYKMGGLGGGVMSISKQILSRDDFPKGGVKKNTSIYPHFVDKHSPPLIHILWISIPPPLSMLGDFIILI